MEKHNKKKTIWNEIRGIWEALLIALILRTLLVQPFIIPSGSMYPNLVVGDYIVVTKYDYGYSRYSMIFASKLPSFGRVFASEPQQGDVAVFREKNSNNDFIKRVIGLPGDTIQVKQGRLYINDTVVPRKRLQDEMYNGRPVAVFQETLPNGTSYRIYELYGDMGGADNTHPYNVPAGHYFMMGDNRDASQDSRFPQVGFVPFEAFVGPAKSVLASFEGGILKFWTARKDRFFIGIK